VGERVGGQGEDAGESASAQEGDTRERGKVRMFVYDYLNLLCKSILRTCLYWFVAHRNKRVHILRSFLLLFHFFLLSGWTQPV